MPFLGQPDKFAINAPFASYKNANFFNGIYFKFVTHNNLFSSSQVLLRKII